MSLRILAILALLFVRVPHTLSDAVLYRYEGDIPPYDEAAGWLIFNPCQDGCRDSLEEGHFLLEWVSGESVNYTYLISNDSGEPPLPPTLWVEWGSGQINPSVGCSIPATVVS